MPSLELSFEVSLAEIVTLFTEISLAEVFTGSEHIFKMCNNEVMHPASHCNKYTDVNVKEYTTSGTYLM